MFLRKERSLKNRYPVQLLVDSSNILIEPLILVRSSIFSVIICFATLRRA
jgi:hypothetical protein